MKLLTNLKTEMKRVFQGVINVCSLQIRRFLGEMVFPANKRSQLEQRMNKLFTFLLIFQILFLLWLKLFGLFAIHLDKIRKLKIIEINLFRALIL